MKTSDVLRVAELCAARILEIGDGYRAKNDELGLEGLPFARAGNINGGFDFSDADLLSTESCSKAGDKVSKAGDVVFTSKGTVGRFAFVRESTPRFVYSPQLCYWRSLDNDRFDPRYLYYWMHSREFQRQVDSVKGQTDMAEYVSLRDQRQMRITLPPINTQRTIAHLLASLDDKLELNHRMNQTLEAMAQALFRSWFVDFDPVQARSEGRQPTGMDAKTAALFPSRFASGPPGKIPDGWVKDSILSVCQILSGGTPKTSVPEYWDGPILWASAKDVSQCDAPYLTGTERTITERGLNESATQLIPAHSTVIIARGATTGRMAMLGQQMAMNQTCYALHSEHTPRYLFSLLANTVSILRQVAHGSVFDTITTATFKTTPVVLPPLTLREAFETAVGPLFDRILHNLRESQTLAHLRDTLLPKLLSGAIRIKDAEALAGAAL